MTDRGGKAAIDDMIAMNIPEKAPPDRNLPEKSGLWRFTLNLQACDANCTSGLAIVYSIYF